MNAEERNIMVSALMRVRTGLETAIVESERADYRATGLAYLRATDSVLHKFQSDATWPKKVNVSSAFAEINANVKAALEESDWESILNHSFTALEALPGETGWSPENLPPPPRKQSTSRARQM